MTNPNIFGQPVVFNEEVKFFKDIHIYGTLYYEFESNTKEKFGDIEVDGNAIFNGNVNIGDLTVGFLTTTRRLDVGIAGTILTASNGKVGINSTSPEQQLDVGGNIKISKDIYDSLNFPGVIGAFLTKDDQGIKWTEFEPAFTEGIFVYNDQVLVGVQSYRGINLKTGRGSGINTDPVQGFPNPTNPNIADIFVYDFWEFVNGTNNIYRNSNVGINNSNPSVALDVSGSVNVTQTLNVDGATTLNSTLDVDGGTTLNSTLDVDGATTLNNTLDVDGATTLNNTLDVDGGTTLNSTLDVDGNTIFNSTTESNNKDTGAVIVQGGVGIEKNLNIGGNTKLIGSLELDSTLIDVNGNTATTKNDYRLSSVGTGVSWRPPGVQTQNAIWVTMDGSDINSGYLEGDAKRTIGSAAEIAEPGDTIFIRSGVYYENNPIGLRTDVSVSGQDLRLVTVIPLNTDKDVFHVRRGCLIENLSFAGVSVSVGHTGSGAVAFPPTELSKVAITGYTAPGPTTEGPTGRWKSPYIRNCTNFMSKSIGMKIDGNHATASTIGADLKCMVCDSFTQYNEAGIGVSITNNGYAQLVSIFTINCDIGIYADTGGSCDLTNSNSSFGNFGLVAVGLGSTEFTGKVREDTAADTDIVGLSSVFDYFKNPRRPYDGQALWFKINLSNYPDAIGSGIITSPLEQVDSIIVTDGGSGYTSSAPPSIIIRDSDGTVVPKGPQGIIAEASPTIDDTTGKIVSIDVINTGRNYISSQNIVIDIDGDATAIVKMSPIYFTVSESTAPTLPTGITTTTFNEFISYELFQNDQIELKRISRILTSSHSFEYIGSGTDINTSTPLQGGIPIKANEVVALDGAQIPFTSTDQKGNFDIGDGLQVDQTTSSIRGRDFSRAIQAEVTPLILALR